MRGEFETNRMVLSIKEHIETKRKLGDGIIAGLKTVRIE